jgi:hypothetical protein
MSHVHPLHDLALGSSDQRSIAPLMRAPAHESNNCKTSIAASIRRTVMRAGLDQQIREFLNCRGWPCRI